MTTRPSKDPTIRLRVEELCAALGVAARAKLAPAWSHTGVTLAPGEFDALVADVVQAVGRKLQPGQRVAVDSSKPPATAWMTFDEALRTLTLSRPALVRLLQDRPDVIRTLSAGDTVILCAADVARVRDDVALQLDPIKSEMVRHAEDIGLYDRGPVVGDPRGKT